MPQMLKMEYEGLEDDDEGDDDEYGYDFLPSDLGRRGSPSYSQMTPSEPPPIILHLPSSWHPLSVEHASTEMKKEGRSTEKTEMSVDLGGGRRRSMLQDEAGVV